MSAVMYFTCAKVQVADSYGRTTTCKSLSMCWPGYSKQER